MNGNLSTLEIILQALEDNAGAILCWQVPDMERDTYEAAHEAGDIGFDVESDCYTHPLAVKVRNSPYDADVHFEMPHQDER